MTDAERTALQATLGRISGIATAASSVLVGPEAIVARLIAAALGMASAMLSQGATAEQAIAAIKRVRHIDTSADDTAVDVKIDAKARDGHGLPARPIGKQRIELPPVTQAATVASACDFCGVAFSEANCMNEDCGSRRDEPETDAPTLWERMELARKGVR